MSRRSFGIVYALIAALLGALILTGNDLAERSEQRASSELRFTFLVPGQGTLSWDLRCRHPADPGPCQYAEALAAQKLLGPPGAVGCTRAPAIQIEGRARSRPAATVVDACDPGRFEILFGFAMAAATAEQRRQAHEMWVKSLPQPASRRNG